MLFSLTEFNDKRFSVNEIMKMIIYVCVGQLTLQTSMNFREDFCVKRYYSTET